MELNEVINSFKSDGALYRCQGIINAAQGKLADTEVIRALRELKKDHVLVFGREVSWYAIAALDVLGVEKYNGNDPDLTKFVTEFPSLIPYLSVA